MGRSPSPGPGYNASMSWLSGLRESARRTGQAAARVVVLDAARTRRAVALLPLALFTLFYGLLALAADPAWRPALLGMTACYLVAFLAIGADWFWGRWFASGIGWWGLMAGVAGMVNLGIHPALAIYTGLHAMIVALLHGSRVAALYDGRADWRERLGLDVHGADRLGRTVRRAAGALPMLLFWALGPRQPTEVAWALAALLPGPAVSPELPPAAVLAVGPAWPALIVPVLVVLALGLVLRGRSAGLLVLAAGAVIGAVGAGLHGSLTGQAAVLVLASAVAPFARPLLSALRAPR